MTLPHFRCAGPRLLRPAFRILLTLLLVLTGSYILNPVAQAQPTQEQIREMRRMMGRGGRGMRSPASQPTPDAENKEEEKKEENKDDAKKEETEDEAKTIKRPTDRPPEYDPNRTKLRPDENGLVQFNYLGQPWTDVLQDYADAAGFTLDWLELPADFLNLTTRRSYTLSQAHDILNRHLLTRGFTMIAKEELLTVVKISNLDPSLVPKAAPDDLEDYSPHDFVRVRFELPKSMDAAKAAEDVKILLSPNAKVQPLLATKRLLVIDIVQNLRSVRDLLYAEQIAETSDIKPRFYKIKHRRADLVADQVMIVLGLDPESRSAPKQQNMNPQQMQMMMQMKQKGQDVSKLLDDGKPKVFVAVDKQQNVLLVNAPEQEFPKIEKTIQLLDVPNGGAAEVAEDSGVYSIERYKTITASADSVIKALNDLANLDPLTQLQGDSNSKTIFAYATARDHAKIVRMIGKLDGSGRRAEVIWLPPNLPADQVAGSLQALIGGQEDEEEDDDMPWYYFRYRDNSKDDKKSSEFRVFPDVENNRLLLWASDDELKEVDKLITKLRQNPDGSFGDNRTVRRFQSQSPKELQKLLEQLKSTWTGDNELEIEVETLEEAEPEQDSTEPIEDPITSTRSPRFHLAQNLVQQKQEEQTAEQKTDEPAPIKITVNAEGELIIASKDTKALDQLQRLIESFSPSEPEYHYFKLKYVYASDVVYNLEKYFEDALADEGEQILDWWGRRQQTKPEPGPLTLGKRRPLRLIDDDFTNTVIVANASPSQLKTIKEIIEQYDQPRQSDDYLPRKTEVIQVKYSRATDIANSLKDVYRDLLSSKDKAFQDKEGKSTSSFTDTKRYVFEDIEKVRRTEYPVVIRFAGVLSVGVDEISNSIIVCAREELMNSVVDTVKALDEAARPKTVVRTYEVTSTIDAKTLRQALAKALGEPWPGGKPLKASANKGESSGQPNQERNGNERRGERRRPRS